MQPDTPGDEPAASDIFDDPRRPRPQEAIDVLAGAGLLTERQAEAFVRREIELQRREELADYLGIAPSTLDDHHGRAKERIAAARETIAILDAYRNPPMPETCDECGATLGGRWVESEAGDVWCRGCADDAPDPADG